MARELRIDPLQHLRTADPTERAVRVAAAVLAMRRRAAEWGAKPAEGGE